MSVWLEATWKTLATLVGIAAFVGLILLAEAFEWVAITLGVIVMVLFVAALFTGYADAAHRRRGGRNE